MFHNDPEAEPIVERVVVGMLGKGYPDGVRPDSDRWIEAILGARLRFHADASGNANVPASYWQRVYQRWGQLYHRVYVSQEDLGDLRARWMSGAKLGTD